MKKLFFPLLLAGLLSCQGNKADEGVSSDAVNVTASAEGKKGGPQPEIRFKEEVHDFGKLTQGERVTHAFEFENVGRSNLIITGARGSCGCTVPEWPREPIKPGEKSKIDVIFGSEGKSGFQDKTITVATNCEPSTRILHIRADVVVPEQAQ